MDLKIGKSEIGKIYKKESEYFICQESYNRCEECYFYDKECQPECNEGYGKGYIYKKLDYYETLFY